MERFTALLDVLEQLGCFILRRGTIESYYAFAGSLAGLDKPASAATEIEAFRAASLQDVERAYADILRCLRRASTSERIVEAESLQDMLLAVVAPALARLKGGTTTSDALTALLRSTLGNQAGLFDLSIADGRLHVALKSKILDVPGFPLSLSPDDNVVTKVSDALGV